jgi:hypothetical protein
MLWVVLVVDNPSGLRRLGFRPTVAVILNRADAVNAVQRNWVLDGRWQDLHGIV